MTQKILREIEAAHLKKEIPVFQTGDLVKVKVLIREGKKERNQAFEGMVIAMKAGGINASFTVRRVFQGVAIERTFLLHSPKVTEVQTLRKGKARRSKLYYMRERVGTKKTRLREDTARIAKDFQAKLVAQEKVEINNNPTEEEVVTTA